MVGNSSPICVEGMNLGRGAGTGALLVYQSRSAGGKSLYAWPMRGRNYHEFRATVRERTVNGHRTWVAIFSGLKAGTYELVGPWGGQEAQVLIEPGAVTQVDWRE